MKKKTIIIILCALIVSAIIATIVITKTYSSKNMLSISRDEITKITLTNGNNGDVYNLNSDEIDKLYKNLTNTKVERIRDEDTSGWLYNVDIFENNSSSSITIISNEQCIISGDRYLFMDQKGENIISVIEGIWKE